MDVREIDVIHEDITSHFEADVREESLPRVTTKVLTHVDIESKYPDLTRAEYLHVPMQLAFHIQLPYYSHDSEGPKAAEVNLTETQLDAELQFHFDFAAKVASEIEDHLRKLYPGRYTFVNEVKIGFTSDEE